MSLGLGMRSAMASFGHPYCRPTLHPAQKHGGVLAAEGDAVGDGMLDAELAPDVGYVIEIAVGVWLVHVNGGWDHAVAHGEQGGGNAGGAAGPLRMADHALQRRARQFV